MDIGVFDHYEEDGQLSFFGFGEEDDGIWMPGDLEAYGDLDGTIVEESSGVEGSREGSSGKEVPGETGDCCVCLLREDASGDTERRPVCVYM